MYTHTSESLDSLADRLEQEAADRLEAAQRLRERHAAQREALRSDLRAWAESQRGEDTMQA